MNTLRLNDNFNPNNDQIKAINHVNGPLLLVAGPGSGKTRVPLWRTFNLIVHHGVKPSEIFLSTFTEKAAKQLKDGLLTLLGSVKDHHYDISEMYVGTVHSLCRRILSDHRFNNGAVTPELMDAVDQYFYIYHNLKQKVFGANVIQTEKLIIQKLNPAPGNSNTHRATIALQALFNRLSEECITPARFSIQSTLLANMYDAYLSSLARNNKTDMSLLQQAAFARLQTNEQSKGIFKHLLIDEYQDTNVVQEKIFFHLALRHKNICVVGDADQALYRFRGATVENLVRFPDRCLANLGVSPTRIDLLTNYRSCPKIVDFYNQFIKTDAQLQNYRFVTTIEANRTCEPPAITITAGTDDTARCDEVAALVLDLKNQGKVNDLNEIAFLYPSVKDPEVANMIKALDRVGLPVYSPRSGVFLESNEAMLIIGLFIYVLGNLPFSPGSSDNSKFKKFKQWLDQCEQLAKNEIALKNSAFCAALDNKKIELDYLLINPRTTWNLLDLFYQFLAIDSLSFKLALAENAGDEGHSCNLSQLSQYLLRFKKMHDISVITREIYGPNGDSLRNLFFMNYLYGLYSLQESDYEDTDNPFPKGRIPFLTIHQAKGLEFPVVILGSMKPFNQKAPTSESLVRPLNSNQATMEPLNLIQQFDAMRLFYVALSRAENLLVLVDSVTKNAPDKRHTGLVETINSMRGSIPSIQQLNVTSLSSAKPSSAPLPKTYSYTMDYQAYQACPRHYMLFRKYRFAPSRTRTMAFGVLVHKTIEDLHRYFIDHPGATTLPTGFIANHIRSNYQLLGQQTAHQLSKVTLKAAQHQIKWYWQKLPNIAKEITDVEVPLTLPGQTTPNKRKYSIYGVVDMAIHKEGTAHLYDIKTHAVDTVRANSTHYEQQLNVYAHIWNSLHGTTLSGTSIIATKLPDSPTRANLLAWNPYVPLTFSTTGVAQTIVNFGQVVDQIEERQFQPKPISGLKSSDSTTYPGKNFAQDVCGQCDGRFSCASYSEYLQQHPEDKQEKIFMQPPIEIEPDLSNLYEKALKPFCKAAFLNDSDVISFIDYFVELINGNKQINHGYRVEVSNQHYNLKNINFTFLQDAFTGYQWKKQDYAANKIKLDAISTALQNAIVTNNDIQFFKACLDCLEWGAGNKGLNLYTRNSEWLWQRRNQTSLISLFNRSHQQLVADCPNLSGFNCGHYRMNSGLTKIYALTYNNFIIYDSRVAAALGRLVTKYCADPNRAIAFPFSLAFAWKYSQRDQVRRNPDITPFYIFDRINNDSLKHAEWNIKANWLLGAVVDKFNNGDSFDGFWGINNQNECLRALEAALFMVGYDVSGAIPVVPPGVPAIANPIVGPDVEDDEEDEEIAAPLVPQLRTLWGIPIRQGNLPAAGGPLRGGWVPTGHNFTNALNYYRNYRLIAPPRPFGTGDFHHFITGSPRVAPKAYNENTYIQQSSEFDLNQKPLRIVEAFHSSGVHNQINIDSLVFLNNYRSHMIWNPRNTTWAGFPKYLMDTYLVGMLAGYPSNQRKGILINLRYAGTNAAAGAIIDVGKSFGLHFGFLDEHYYPTQLFNEFFLDDEPLVNWINNVIP